MKEKKLFFLKREREKLPASVLFSIPSSTLLVAVGFLSGRSDLSCGRTMRQCGADAQSVRGCSPKLPSLLLCLFAQLSQASQNTDLGSGPSRAHRSCSLAGRCGRRHTKLNIKHKKKIEPEGGTEKQLSCYILSSYRYRLSTRGGKKGDKLLLFSLLLHCCGHQFRNGQTFGWRW